MTPIYGALSAHPLQAAAHREQTHRVSRQALSASPEPSTQQGWVGTQSAPHQHL